MTEVRLLPHLRFIEVWRTDHVVTIRIARAEVMNALHPEAHQELAQAFDHYAQDPDLRVAIITGTGDKAFCTGTDLKHLAATGEHHTPESGFAGLTARFDLDKPVVAMVNGAAVGGGLEIVLACDLAIAVDNATFGFPEPRVGLAAMGGGLHRLVRHIPHKLAMSLILTGRRIDASEALRLGVLNAVVPPSQLEDTTRAWVEQILECAPLAVQASKAVARDSMRYPSLGEAIDASYQAAEIMERSGDAREGPLAFAEKRKPRWSGR